MRSEAPRARVDVHKNRKRVEAYNDPRMHGQDDSEPRRLAAPTHLKMRYSSDTG